MKTLLTRDLVLRCTFHVAPVVEDEHVVDWRQRDVLAPYYVFDTSREAPIGFGLKVSATLKSFVLQKRVGRRVVKAKVGNVRDFPSLKHAREKAKEMAEEMERSGRNPNVLGRERQDIQSAADLTLAEVFTAYRAYLVNRADKPVKPSSLKNFDLALRRLHRPEANKLATKRLREITDEVVRKSFTSLAASPRPGHPLATKPKKLLRPKDPNQSDLIAPRGIRTAAEQTFRWANVATRWALELEQRSALQQRRAVSIEINPFDVLRTEGLLRSREVLEKSYAHRRVRNPLSRTDGSLGRFLDALWERRRVANNETAVDYLLLTLLWGMRRSEAAELKWRDRIGEGEARASSYIDLEGGVVYLHDTKNGQALTLPLAPGAREILIRRREGKLQPRGERAKWVFPARSSRAKAGHYKDSKSIVAGLRKRAKLPRFTPHDARRTFATIAEETVSYAMVKRLLNHRNLADVTGTSYIKVEDARVREAMARIERMILETSPTVARAVLPLPH